ncbi:MAG: hypothetical protein K2H04_07345 [Bacteroidaceae bacterium]|nr:hypothetical protein [Bacteroidaceae bacterium]MDE5999866.1 hypothetical protein [Bacteroidaceae bacterium]
MTREEALQRFKQAKERKRITVEKLEQHMKEKYERETGQKANYFFVM